VSDPNFMNDLRFYVATCYANKDKSSVDVVGALLVHLRAGHILDLSDTITGSQAYALGQVNGQLMYPVVNPYDHMDAEWWYWYSGYKGL